MTKSERSIMFYLLDAIRSSPKDYVKLCSLVAEEKDNCSLEFYNYLDKLKNCKSQASAKLLGDKIRIEIV